MATLAVSNVKSNIPTVIEASNSGQFSQMRLVHLEGTVLLLDAMKQERDPVILCLCCASTKQSQFRFGGILARS